MDSVLCVGIQLLLMVSRLEDRREDSKTELLKACCLSGMPFLRMCVCVRFTESENSKFVWSLRVSVFVGICFHPSSDVVTQENLVHLDVSMHVVDSVCLCVCVFVLLLQLDLITDLLGTPSLEAMRTACEGARAHILRGPHKQVRHLDPPQAPDL